MAISSPPSLLSLPREIRDMIYSHLLLSPNGYMTPISQRQAIKASRQSPGTPIANLCAHYPAPKNVLHKPNTLLLVPCDPFTAAILPSSSSSSSSPLQHNFPLVCKQIHTETSHLLWKNNILILPGARSVIRIFKHMGQKPSRLIQNVHLHFSESDSPAPTLVKALRMIASRARYGRLRHLRIVCLEDMSGASPQEMASAPGSRDRPPRLVSRWLPHIFYAVWSEMRPSEWREVQKEVVVLEDWFEARLMPGTWVDIERRPYDNVDCGKGMVTGTT